MSTQAPPVAPTDDPTDPWHAKAYTTAAPFVPLLTSRITHLLSPQPTDVILDLGCGDGILTADIARACRAVVGVDSSANLIGHAQRTYQSEGGNLTFVHHDGRDMSGFSQKYPTPDTLLPRTLPPSTHYTKIFSNAALHWILPRPAPARKAVLQGIYTLLPPSGGQFIAEFGAHLNVSEVHAQLYSSLLRRGVPLEKIKSEVDPWYFPTEDAVRRDLEGAGFTVTLLETEFRPTKLAVGEGGGVEGWVRLFGERFLGAVKEEERDEVVREVSTAVEAVGADGEGGVWVGYRRVRFVAERPAET